MGKTAVFGKLNTELYSRSLFDYLYVFVMIIYAGMANEFVRSFGTEKPMAVVLPVTLSFILALKYKITLNKKIYLLLLGYVIYNFVLALKFKAIYPIFFGYLVINFLITYITVKALKLSFFVIYEKLLYFLTVIALVLWLIQISMGGDNLLLLLSRIPSIETFSTVTWGGLNIIIYSVQPIINLISSNSTIARNCGFAWEPGAFAVYLCLAIFINLFLIKTEKKFNSRFWIFLIGLLSTQSTTGYVIFILIMIFFLFQKNIKIVLILLPFLILGVVFIFSLPFMRDKIIEVFEEANRVDMIVEESIGVDRARNPQRFASFIIAMRDFKNNPVLGFGGQVEERWYHKIGSNIAPISGIGNLLAQYGMVGFLFFIVLLTKNSETFSQFFAYNGRYLFLLIILLITISYSIVFTVIIMSFWMFFFFEDMPHVSIVNNENTGNPVRDTINK